MSLLFLAAVTQLLVSAQATAMNDPYISPTNCPIYSTEKCVKPLACDDYPTIRYLGIGMCLAFAALVGLMNLVAWQCNTLVVLGKIQVYMISGDPNDDEENMETPRVAMTTGEENDIADNEEYLSFKTKVEPSKEQRLDVKKNL